ncbi:hypothetical protein AC579_8421 [Pseudocercospora musae]|uniref:Major facilitator superfamily (MFS) profile domain-containing protein n=1 Tax=Pseudocercospora musae TaxID=113226 RepID=A0A139IHS1_9PEZI|nr:hypothetical protein AC579_8421 [Pseudocercospora musae]
MMGFHKKDTPPQEDQTYAQKPQLDEEKDQDLDRGDDESQYPHGYKLAVLMTCVFIGMFLVALDKLIITTATPAITNEFHAYSDVGWYGTAYLLTNCATILLFGKLYTFLNVKVTFLSAVLLFEVGSAVCGSAPNSIAFIIGRAIAGLGAGGIQEGVLVIIVCAIPLSKRPAYQGLFGAVYGVSSVIGPLLGGAFTTNVTWRWCFYINLPFGGLVAFAVFFLLKVPGGGAMKRGWKHKVKELNIEGLVALLPGVISLCLALQWGGFTYSWSNWRIILCLTLGVVLLIAFIFIQAWRPKTAIVPPHIFCQRSIFTGFWVSGLLGAHQTIIIYFLPIWFQAIKGNSAVESGIHLLPFVIAIVVSSILTGVGTTKTGYYTPFLIIGTVIAAIGAGLFLLLNPNTTTGEWIGYQIVYGFGLGGCFQAPNVAAQTVLSKDEAPVGTALILFATTLFGAIFVSVGQNVLDQQLATKLAGLAGIDITPEQIETAGITGLFQMVPAGLHNAVLYAYNSALRRTFLVGVIVACLTIVGALGMEWRSVKKEQQKEQEKAMENGNEKDAGETKKQPETEQEGDRTLSTGTEMEKDTKYAESQGEESVRSSQPRT